MKDHIEQEGDRMLQQALGNAQDKPATPPTGGKSFITVEDTPQPSQATGSSTTRDFSIPTRFGSEGPSGNAPNPIKTKSPAPLGPSGFLSCSSGPKGVFWEDYSRPPPPASETKDKGKSTRFISSPELSENSWTKLLILDQARHQTLLEQVTMELSKNKLWRFWEKL